MRKIKYRAWHKQEKRMYHWGSGVIAIDHQLNVETVPSGRLLRHEDVELMQFTGLLDKNGREIFEGDIVHTENDQQYDHPVESCYHGVVTYLEDGYHIVQTHDAYKPALRNHAIQSIEVIGNIWEHRHLLVQEGASQQ